MPQPRTPPARDALERARYFDRQAVGAADLTQDHDYFAHRLRRHNRLLHGWGVLTAPPLTDGLAVVKVAWAGADGRKKFEADNGVVVPPEVEPADGYWFLVRPGYAVTPLGDELFCPDPMFVNVGLEVGGFLVTVPPTCPPDLAPTRRPDGATVYLVASAAEVERRPVRAPGNRCGDHPDRFEPARYQDAVAFFLRPDLPAGGPYPDAAARLTGCGLAFDYVPLAALKFSDSGAESDTAFTPVRLPAPTPPAADAGGGA